MHTGSIKGYTAPGRIYEYLSARHGQWCDPYEMQFDSGPPPHAPPVVTRPVVSQSCRWVLRCGWRGTKEIGMTNVEMALEIIECYGDFDGAHHKQWVLDQVVRTLTGDGYDEWVRQHCHGINGPRTYIWDIGIPP